MGRPTLYTDEKRLTVLAALRLGLSYESAAKLVRVDRNTLLNWRQMYPDFAEECEDAIAQCEQGWLRTMRRHAKKDHKAAAWLMERRFPRAWGNLRPEVLAARVASLEPPEADPTGDASDDDLVEAAKGK